jgi:hypothetical protein
VTLPCAIDRGHTMPEMTREEWGEFTPTLVVAFDDVAGSP